MIQPCLIRVLNHGPPYLDVSSSEEDDSIISHADVDGHEFDYRKILPALVPEGWANDPNDLEPVNRALATDDYSLPPFVLPILASREDGQAGRYLFSIFGRFYLWTPASSEFLSQDTKKLKDIKELVDGHEYGLHFLFRSLSTMGDMAVQSIS
ncbi:hypothetical protein HO133_006257 [Letharia lupina]|uniref:Uncharacterized protein n=1 Tax=Letharia lupina TaxID=560253 RepID=A0A8H6C6B8_9LECA|nr:uncharacterized protein HO133_006257 [Letharia lupina]KAF6217845.1 hypothetical protein HO133_006257 [Letharia lupina]